MQINNTPFNPQRSIDPDSYAKNYANQKGISLEEAKSELKAKYGDPKQKSEQNNFSMFTYEKENANPPLFQGQNNPPMFNGIKQDRTTQLFPRLNNPPMPNIPRQDMNQSIFSQNDFQLKPLNFNFSEQSLLNNDIQFEEMFNLFEENPLGLNPQEQKLLDIGVPLNVIDSGDWAIMEYMIENNIDLDEYRK